MYLKALVIQGFKSFPDKTVLSFGEDITAIVGPNGSGKSNIADAIRWVMGEQSSRTLRGSKMEDVIFDGTARRTGMNFAEVSLVLDNTEQFFPLEEAEIMVTRRYYRSGESEYYINNRSCRLKDINELFMDTGLGREGYSIIGQGRIDEILSVRSTDRREIFEEAAGISRFRHRKEEAERKLAHTQENLVRVNDKIDELELQVAPLRAQAEKTKQFLVLHDELRTLEISVWLEQLTELRADSIRIMADYEQTTRRQTELRAELDSIYAASETFSEQIHSKDMEIDRIRLQLSCMETNAHESEKVIGLLKKDMDHNAANANRLRNELDQQENRTDSISGQIAERQARLSVLESEISTLQFTLDKLSQDRKTVLDSAGRLQDELEALRKQETLDHTSATEAKALLSALAAAAQELFDREKTLKKERIALAETVEHASASHAQVAAELAEAVRSRDAVRNVISGHELLCQSRRRKAEEASERLRRLRMDSHNLDSRIQMLTELEKSYEGYSKAVRLVMSPSGRNELRGIHGPVADLIHVSDRCTVAIETALGSAMQNIVVDTDENGKHAIAFLKRRDGGRATFLPLNTIRSSEFRDTAVQQEPGFVGMGDTLIRFDEPYAAVFSNLLGRVVVVEDLDQALAIARKFHHRFRIVTLDGQVLNAGGSMTGGSASRSAGILSRANELERLRSQKETLAADLSAAAKSEQESQRELTSSNYELETAREQLRCAEDSMLTLGAKVDHSASYLHDVTARLESITAELEQFAARLAENQRDTERTQTRIRALEGSASALHTEAETKRGGQTELQEQLTVIHDRIAAVNTDLAARIAEQSVLQQSLVELETLHRNFTGERTQRLEIIARFESQNTELTQQIRQEEEKLLNLRTSAEEQNTIILRLNQEKLALEGQRNQADKSSRDKNDALLNLEHSISLLEQKKLSVSLEEKNLLDKLWENYELSHEAAQAQRIELESIPKTNRRISELKRDISALGSINPDAVEEFQRVNDRYTYFTSQRDDVEKSKKDLEGIIQSITQKMAAIFSEQFKLISESFQQTFAELFGGGKGTLELEDETDLLNCGIEIRVQPPGKALKVISLLSGGEKAFVAIALYFAILKVRPTPFCVMDEIDAALDDSNVVRFAHYLRRMTEKTQFIVITHRRGTMEETDVLYGVTMQEKGISRILTINLNEIERELNLK